MLQGLAVTAWTVTYDTTVTQKPRFNCELAVMQFCFPAIAPLCTSACIPVRQQHAIVSTFRYAVQ